MSSVVRAELSADAVAVCSNSSLVDAANHSQYVATHNVVKRMFFHCCVMHRVVRNEFYFLQRNAAQSLRPIVN